MKRPLSLRIEKYLIFLCLLLFLGSSTALGVLYYQDNSEKTPAIGGLYKEAMVGNISGLNPLFADINEAEQDVSHLLFRGLTRYHPGTKNIVEDIATFSISTDQKTYTFTLKEGMYWHDGTPVTAADVVFTYHDIIQNPQFSNEFLRQSFEGIAVEAVDERTITFTLSKPYAFFPSLVTLGLLPKHVWETVPVSQLRDHVINKAPIGNGPYKIMESIQTAVLGTTPITRVQLERFGEYHEENTHHMQYITFELYPSEEFLIPNINQYNGAKRISQQYIEQVQQQTSLELHSYPLPQYVSLFFNTQSPVLSDSKVRLGLRLATDKDKLLAPYPDAKRIDTPFLELDEQSWKAQYDRDRANGSLFDAGWKVKEGETLITDPSTVPPTPLPIVVEEIIPDTQELTEETTEETPTTETETPAVEEEEETTLESTPQYFINKPTSKERFLTGSTSVVISGTLPPNTQKVRVGTYGLQLYEAGASTFTYTASTTLGNLVEGDNLFEVYITNSEGVETNYDQVTVVHEPNRSTDVEESMAPDSPTESTTTEEAEETSTETVESEEETTEATTETTEETPEVTPEEGIQPSIPVRYKNDQPLILSLVTRDTPAIYATIAEEIRREYALIGVDVHITVVDSFTMQQVLDEKNYDILLFGQRLGYNLDAYPFWHSSQAGKGGVNFSNYQSFRANQHLESMRTPTPGLSIDELQEERRKTLKVLEEIFSEETPAIFLYQPLYYYGIDPSIKGFQLQNLAYHKDRFASLPQWFLQEQLQWNREFSLGDLWNWLYKNLQ